MKIYMTLILLCFFLIGCNHPESKIYERNQGKAYENNESNYDIRDINAQEKNVQSNKWQEDRNVLKMELENGVRYVWIEINGIKLRFIFDTGASNICISPAEATVLYRQSTLR